jgi:hypothetical protein
VHFDMRWSEIRVAYPEQWLVVEVYSAHHDGIGRVIDDVEVYGSCSNGMTAAKCAFDLERRFRTREFIAVHSCEPTPRSDDRPRRGHSSFAARSVLSL